MSAPIGRPRYSIGNTDAETRPSASRSPRHVVNASAASTTNADIRIASSATAVPTIVSPIQRVDVTPTEVSSVAAPLTITGSGYPAALDRREYSTNDSTSRASATAKKSGAGANQTTAM